MKIIKISCGEKVFNVNSSTIMWLILLLILAFFVLIKDYILPEYFYFDSSYIEDSIALADSLYVKDSFMSTAFLYKIFGIRSYSLIYGIVTGFFVISVNVIAIYRTKIRIISLKDFFCFFICVFFSICYLTVLSKDFWVLLVNLIFVIDNKKYRGFFIWIGIAIIYALFIRNYWFLFLSLIPLVFFG